MSKHFLVEYWRSLILLVATAPAIGYAQSGRMVYQEYDKLIQSRTSIQSLGADLFGDSVNLYTGALDIVQTDVDLPGNSSLQVRIGRRFRVAQGEDWAFQGHFADWDLDIPRLHGVFGTYGGGWIVSQTGTNKYKRCSLFYAPPNLPSNISGGGTFQAEDYWHGNMFYLPGVGDQEMLSSPTFKPADGNAYPVGTKDGTVMRCLTSLATTSQVGSQGEGFEAVTPDGTVYTFNHMAYLDSYPESVKPEMEGYEGYLFRTQVLIFPTRVTDRFGNNVTYTWSSVNPWRLLSITANDGRSITINYAGSSGFRISSVSDGAHTWTYGYGAIGTGLTSVMRPDSSSWSFAISDLAKYEIKTQMSTCDDLGAPDAGDLTVNMTHPGGARIELTVAPLLAGRSWARQQCYHYDLYDPELGYALYPRVFYTTALAKKKLMGPGLPAGGSQWLYSYGPDNGCWDPAYTPAPNMYMCSGSSPVTRTVSVTNPDSSVTRYTFGNRSASNEGKLLQVDEGWTGSSAARSTVNTYSEPWVGPYAQGMGQSWMSRGDSQFNTYNMPLKKRTISQEGRNFTWQAASDCGGGSGQCFDARARPTKVTKSSAPWP